MATIDIGTKPTKVTITLAYGGSFTTELNNTAGNWPTGISIKLVFKESPESINTITWTATIAGTKATWDMSVTAVNEVIESRFMTVRLHYVEPDGSVLVWGSGEVNVL